TRAAAAPCRAAARCRAGTWAGPACAQPGTAPSLHSGPMSDQPPPGAYGPPPGGYGPPPGGYGAPQGGWGPPPSPGASGPPPPPPPQWGYGPPPPPRREHPDTALIAGFGIGSLVSVVALCGLLLPLAPIAWAKGNRALEEIRASNGTMSGEEMI